MLISDLIRRGRWLYAQCDQFHSRVALDLTLLPPEFDHTKVGKRLNCSQCRNSDVLAIPNRGRTVKENPQELALLFRIARRGPCSLRARLPV